MVHSQWLTRLMLTFLSGCLCALAQTAAPARERCDEFLSKSTCSVEIDMRAVANNNQAPTHSDVQTKVGGDATVRLIDTSPFLACTIQATPAVPARDLSTSVTAALTTVGGIGAPARALAEDAGHDAAWLTNELKGILHASWKYTFFDTPPTPVSPAKSAEEYAAEAVKNLRDKLQGLLNEEVSIETFIAGQSGVRPDVIKDQLDQVRKIRDTIRQYNDFVKAVDTSKPLTVNELAMDRFRQKSVSETITCKDAVTQAQPFPTMTFTAYYENTPTFDISAGAIMSLTPGRQVGVVSSPILATGPVPIMSGSTLCVPSSSPAACLGVTSRSAVQFMPAAFFEWHKNWKWPGVANGDAYHPFGYVGSFGPAFGISVNPNNGTASAEFFEGVSLGIQRISILAGLHNGRFQTFTDGYYVGEEVPMGTTPRTERAWTNHLALGISYRIPLH